ncbi:indolepyruvate ferredoxin oxidoreductase family protein [Rhodospirillaceae bacterium R-7]|uniref:Indolepyruvate ferredoxin oxidoreductase family protein n=1 Tax=Dongia sedimenti TaxID=3064282 RepID=A0ABU0YIS2_9PROT|nr:indolepyruvate ferredoxin oxidoreductase family protein [Rhodospirillaceae bacterium R-7]
MSLAAVALDDKYVQDKGRVYLTGTQALVRLPLMQRRRDLAAGLNTAGYITGYRGSPLGGLDTAATQARRFLEAHHVRFQPGVNEDLAATAVWGTQQNDLFGDAVYDGVFAMWYAKGPGVDRSGDALRHGNLAGSSKQGGVLVLAGDDHTCKSSTTAHQSEYALMDANIPVLNPSGVQEILDFGLHGWAMSRYSGAWVGLKVTAETTDVAASVDLDPARVEVRIPSDFAMPPGGLSIRFPSSPLAGPQALEQELRLHKFKVAAAVAYARANGLDRVTSDGPGRRFGIVTCGKSYLDVRQALEDLGIDEAQLRRLGVAIYKVGLTWPLEPQGARRFAEGLEEVLVVEEKRSLIETQLKEQLFHLPDGKRPRIIGKFDESGAWILPSADELSATMIARAIVTRIAKLQPVPELEARLQKLEQREAALKSIQPPIRRIAYFCSGCPHNTSTKVPEGSTALAGIGCHYMSLWMDRNTATFTQMGGEGGTWIGRAPFSKTKHVFQNMGDGTYYHSGSLAIRAAVAANTTITFKILYNDAVAMTGGQPMDGPLSPAIIARQLAAEGVKKVAVVSEQPERYAESELPSGTPLRHRDDLDEIQRAFREIEGVTAIVYDQTCAAEKRRRRKRGLMEDPPKRVFINQEVCEGCGDCGVQSNCLSVTPVETAFGRKRAIDQSSCNKDFSCLKGFCPSFVTVEGGRLRKPKPVEGADVALPEPVLPKLDRPYGILVTGIGGTGVVTIGQLLGMAAHLEGKGCSVMDLTGLAQKGGAVLSHVRIADRPDRLHAVRIGTAQADLLLGCDLVVSASPDALGRAGRERTTAIVNAQETVTGDFTRNADWDFPAAKLQGMIRDVVGKAVDFPDATRLATALMGDAIATNPFMLGFAYQRGLIPLSAEALFRAIELNGVAIEFNKRAFHWGRRAAIDLSAVEGIASPATAPLPQTLPEIVAHRRKHLTGYQNAAYADRYQALVDKVAAAERARMPGSDALARAVAKNYAKLLAYKDEYEVARLYTDGAFRTRLAQQFDGGFALKVHLAPPLWAKRDPATGHLKKQAYGGWAISAFGLLAKLKGLRGTKLDPFGYAAERRAERQLIADYESLVAELVTHLTPANHAAAVALASLPETIRGFGHVKDASIAKAEAQRAELLAAFRNPAAENRAAQ